MIRGRKEVKSLARTVLWLLLSLLLFLNGMAYLHAYRFTHFEAAKTSAEPFQKTTDLRTLPLAQKALLLGVPLPRPQKAQ